MECNKEEAIRAKAVAELKLQNKDFIGARKFALKAQHLHPEVENISRLLSVCDVHCAAENKVCANEMDWYGILEVEQTADDTMIKKQYRKFALLLHPDKNQFAGAEAAFKLVGEAQRVLLDKQKRSFHDMKRRTSYKSVAPHQPSQQTSSNVRPKSTFPSNPSSHVRASNVQATQPANAKPTFWTFCIHCSVRYQYYKDVMGKAICCQTCKKSFVAYECQVFRSGATEPVSLKQGAPCAASTNVGSMNKNAKPSSNTGFQAGQNVSSKGHKKADEGSKRHRSNGRKRKQRVESSESCYESDSSSSSSLDSDEVDIHETLDPRRSQQFDSDGDRQTRRSNRNKKRVYYDENASGDEQVATPAKKSKLNGSTEEKVDPSNNLGSSHGEDSRKKECGVDDQNETVASSTDKSFEVHDEPGKGLDQTPDSTPEPTYYECPDPEFCEFEKNREVGCFKVGQIWAIYDTHDAMPRFYARIKKVYATGFKLQISWLEADPDDESEKEWINSDLPYSCGKFMIGTTDTTEDLPMFSHVVHGCKSIGKKNFMIHPRMGETWAIYKNWDQNWCLILEDERKFEYDFVEVLCDYDEVVGIRVAPLGKLKGFASLFCRKIVNEIHIKPNELLRFSHMVPSYTTTGNEKIKVPKGYIELDPASTTPNIDEIPHPPFDTKNSVNDVSSVTGKNGPANGAAAAAAAAGSKGKNKNGVK